jgi:hypothetical protein
MLLGRCGCCLLGQLGVANWPLHARVRGNGLRGGGAWVAGRLGQAAVRWPSFFFSFIIFSFSISCFFHNFFKIAPNELKPISKFF